jgi:hypothetical protein
LGSTFDWKLLLVEVTPSRLPSAFSAALLFKPVGVFWKSTCGDRPGCSLTSAWAHTTQWGADAGRSCWRGLRESPRQPGRKLLRTPSPLALCSQRFPTSRSTWPGGEPAASTSKLPMIPTSFPLRLVRSTGCGGGAIRKHYYVLHHSYPS